MEFTLLSQVAITGVAQSI